MFYDDYDKAGYKLAEIEEEFVHPPIDPHIIVTRDLMRQQFPDKDILTLTQDEFLVFFYGIAEAVKRHEHILDEGKESDYALYDEGFERLMHELSVLKEMKQCIEENHCCLEEIPSYGTLYLVPMPQEWNKQLVSFLRGASVLFRGTVRTLTGKGKYYGRN